MGPIKAAGKYRQEGKTYVRPLPDLQVRRRLKEKMIRLSKTETSSTFSSVSHSILWLKNPGLLANPHTQTLGTKNESAVCLGSFSLALIAAELIPCPPRISSLS